MNGTIEVIASFH